MPEGGGEWLVPASMSAGEPWPGGNPRLTVAPEWHEFVGMWDTCRGPEGGVAHWPDAGGLGDQAAWVVDAFRTLGSAQAQWRDLEMEAKR